MACLHVFLLTLVVVIPESKTDVYLKSTGDIKTISGREVILIWEAYDNKELTQPCHFEKAADNSSPPVIFLGFEYNQEYRPDNKTLWQFTEPNNPCAGGIKKNVSLNDTGIYTMKMEHGYNLDLEHAQTQLKVYDVKQLNFSVEVNDYIHQILVMSGLSVTLDRMKIDSKADVVVKLNELFPNTSKVTIERSLSDKTCDNQYHVVQCSLDLQNSDSIRVIVETDIMGADVITVLIPVSQESHANVSAIILGMLLAIAIVGIVCMLLYIFRLRGRFQRSL